MEELSYDVIKEILIEDYNDFINVELYSTEQAIAALLEDSVTMMKGSENNYVSVIVVLAVISLESNTIPNYILERLEGLLNSSLEAYRYNYLLQFVSDKDYITKQLDKMDFNVLDDEYKKRVDMLFGIDFNQK